MGTEDALNEALEGFLAQRRPNTRRLYRRVLGAIRQRCKSVAGANASDIVAFLGNLRAQGRSDNTIKIYLDVASSIFGWLHDMELIHKNPARIARRALSMRQRHQVRPTATIPTNLVPRILAQIDGHDWKATRDRAIVALLFGAGLRRSEAIGLNLGDVRVSPEGVVFLTLMTTKAGEIQERAVPSWAAEMLSDVVQMRARHGAQGDDAVFVTKYAGGWSRVSEVTLYRRFKQIVAAAVGIEAAPHAARAAFATRLMELGYHDRDVAKALGHGDAQMVAVYDKRRNGATTSAAVKIKY